LHGRHDIGVIENIIKGQQKKDMEDSDSGQSHSSFSSATSKSQVQPPQKVEIIINTVRPNGESPQRIIPDITVTEAARRQAEPIVIINNLGDKYEKEIKHLEDIVII
jgi:hypothetical protein